MKNNNIIVLILTLFLLTACTKEQVIELSKNDVDSFFLKNNGAIMPVLVKGNTASKVFCITMHGGPGDSGIQGFAYSNAFSEVEKSYAMVYYDQRCAGLSQGNCNAEKLEIADYVDDIDRLITLLKFKYGEEISIFLLGHSWGGTLGIDYLINGKRKNEIKGFVQTNGSHNIPMLIQEQREFMLHHAKEQIALGNNLADWEAIKNKVESIDISTFEGKINMVQETNNLEKLFLAVDSINASSLRVDHLLEVTTNVFITLKNSSINDNQPFYEKLIAYDASAQLPLISTPIAFYWGWFDAVHPPAMVQDMYARIGSFQKELYFFKKSFHSPFANENEEYQTKVIGFIKAHE